MNYELIDKAIDFLIILMYLTIVFGLMSAIKKFIWRMFE